MDGLAVCASLLAFVAGAPGTQKKREVSCFGTAAAIEVCEPRRTPSTQQHGEVCAVDEAVQRLQMGLVGSKGTIASVPVSDAAKAKYGEDKAAYEKAFRKSLLASIMVSFEIEQAILDGDSAAAKAGLTKLHDTEESGHSLFQEGDEANNEKEGGKSAAPRARGSRGQNAPATKD